MKDNETDKSKQKLFVKTAESKTQYPRLEPIYYECTQTFTTF